MTNEVKIALTEVKKYHPEVCMVLFGQDGSWMFMDKDLGRPRFSDKIDVSIVGEACDSVNYFPAIFFAEDIRYDSLQYVREKRGLDFVVVDIKVEFFFNNKTTKGLIKSGNEYGNLQILFEGENVPRNCHPC